VPHSTVPGSGKIENIEMFKTFKTIDTIDTIDTTVHGNVAERCGMPEIRPPGCGFFPDIPSSCWQFAFMLELNYEGGTSDSDFSDFGDLSDFSQFSQFGELRS
jgi:hypothetical protein